MGAQTSRRAPANARGFRITRMPGTLACNPLWPTTAQCCQPGKADVLRRLLPCLAQCDGLRGERRVLEELRHREPAYARRREGRRQHPVFERKLAPDAAVPQ